jgi:uncharacterized protein
VIRVTADSNIYISAFNFGGTPLRLLDLAIDGEIILSISSWIISEIREVLNMKFGWPMEDVNRAEEFIFSITEPVRMQLQLDVIQEDPDDNHVLECALAGRSEYIVTGDKHLLKLRQLADIRIMKVADFIQLLEGLAAMS